MDPLKTKIILVGNSKFPNWGSGNKNIENASVNIERLEKVIRDDQYFGIKNDSQLISIINKSSQEILLKVKHETEKSDDRGKLERLIFYYCGHGIPGEDGILFFASSDTVRDDYELTAVNAKHLYKYIKKFGAKETIIIIDCCYAAQSLGNAGDEDSLIKKSLPESISAISENETETDGVYYLFASGKDNVAKFNPADSDSPTYFTEALLNAILNGTDPSKDFIRVEELEENLTAEINKLKATKNFDIPKPFPVREGQTEYFEFCKNIKVLNQEDIDWENTLKDINFNSIEAFYNKYPETKYAEKALDLMDRLSEAKREFISATNAKDSIKIKEIQDKYSTIHEVVKWCKAWRLEYFRNSKKEPIEISSSSSAELKTPSQNVQYGKNNPPSRVSSGIKREATEIEPENRNADLSNN